VPVPGPVGDDQIRPFQVDDHALRGRVSRLSGTVDNILQQHDYPTPVAALLGEALTLASLLAGMLKYDGVLTVQSTGDGPVRTLLADITSDGNMRGYARFDPEAIGDRKGRALVGKGYLAFTLDQGGEDRYQGIVEWSGETLADCVRHYFAQSEQLRSEIRLSVGQVGKVGDAGRPIWRAGGILIQRLPRADAATDGNVVAADLDEAGWETARRVVEDVAEWDLLDPTRDQDDLLRQLFPGRPVRVFDPISVTPTCRCSRERVELVLRSLSDEDLADLTLPDGRVEATCEFCSTQYWFTPDDLSALRRPDM